MIRNPLIAAGDGVFQRLAGVEVFDDGGVQLVLGAARALLAMHDKRAAPLQFRIRLGRIYRH